MDILPRELPLLTIAQLRTCSQLPDWLEPLLIGRPDDELCKVLYEELQQADGFRRELPARVGFCALLGLALGPPGSLVGGLGGLLASMAVRPALLARGQAPAGSSSRFAEWLKRPGPPFTEPLENEGWIDRRYPVSEHLPLREVWRDPQGKATEFRFCFRQLDVRCLLEQEQIIVSHPSGESCTFPGKAHYHSEVVLYFKNELSLYLQLDGQLRVVEKDPYSAGYHYPYCEDTGLRQIAWNQATGRIPFPLDWVDPEAVAGDSAG